MKEYSSPQLVEYGDVTKLTRCFVYGPNWDKTDYTEGDESLWE